ncbi:MAG: YfiR family protein [Fimbriimonadaceae bacterium]|nr:YfiR family protein [Fimbriimonadaceae bacterium]
MRLLGVALLVVSGSLRAQQVSEYQLKAAFLVKFTAFVVWPPKSLPPPKEPFVIGIVGADPFGRLLDDAVKDKSVEGRPIVVRRFAWGQSLDACRVVFMSDSEGRKVARLLLATQGKPILTVGETERFAQQGGMIGLRVLNSRAAMDVNLGSARANGLAIRSGLLQVANSVIDGSRGGSR